MKYLIITFGCQMNRSDSERIASVLERIGYERALKENEADLIIVNMCSVRQSAVDRVYGMAKKFAKLKCQMSNLKTLLTGCISKKDLQKFKEKFDFVLSIKALSKWPEFLKKEKFCFYPNPREERFFKEFGACYLKERAKPEKNFSVFVPISTGCDNFCSFCIVPFVRGPLICRDHKDILNEVKLAIKNGAKEIWLLGQNVNDYCSPSGNSIDFPKLLEMINEIEGKFWIRFTSSNPFKNFSDRLIEKMAKCQKLAPYLNLPVQSGDDQILRKMNRPYDVKYFKNLIKKIRQAFKKYRKGLEREIAISTDIIVGFPGETEKQFQNTVKLFKEIKFDMAYIARYSPRPGTVAAKLKDDVPAKEKERRWKILTEILKKTALEKNKKYIGKEVEILIDSFKKNFYFGKTRTYKTVKLKAKSSKLKANLIGQFAKAKITDSLPWGLKGILI